MEQRALALDEQQVAALGALVHEPLAGAGDVVGDDVVDRDAPAGDRHAGLPGRHVDRAPPALARRPVELERHDLLADHGVRADAVHHPAPVRAAAGPVGHRQVGRRGAQVAQRHPGARRPRGAARGPRRAGCAARPRRRRPAAIASSSVARHAGSSLPPVGATPISSAVGARARSPRRSVATIGTGRRQNGHDLVGRAAGLGRVDHGHHVARAVADHAVGGLAVVRGEQALGEDREPLAHAAGSTPEPGPVRRAARARPRAARPRNGSSASSRCPSRSTQSTSEASCAAGAIAELRLDHAAEHHAQPEGARRVHHAQRLAHAPGLGQLDVDAVGVAGDRRDVAEVLAALVDDHAAAAATARAERGRSRGRRPGTAARRARRPARPAPASARAPSRASSPRWRRRAAAASDSLAHRLQPRQVLGAADLDLERPEAARPARAVARALERVDADRERGRRRRGATGRAAARPARRAARPTQSCSAASSAARPRRVARPAGEHVLEANGSSPSRRAASARNAAADSVVSPR